MTIILETRPPPAKATHLSQSTAHPFHLSKIVNPALDGVVRALSDRGNQSEEQRLARANDYLTLILSFLPRDAIDITLAGQTIVFNELLADGARDVLRGMMDTMKQRSVSSLVAMGRLTQGHVDRLEKRGARPYRTEVIAPPEEADDASAAPRSEPAKRPPAAKSRPAPPPSAATPPPSAPPPSAPAKTGREDPEMEMSWLDEPFEQWVIETPAELARQTGISLPVEPLAPARANSPMGNQEIDAGAPSRKSDMAGARPAPLARHIMNGSAGQDASMNGGSMHGESIDGAPAGDRRGTRHGQVNSHDLARPSAEIIPLVGEPASLSSQEPNSPIRDDRSG